MAQKILAFCKAHLLLLPVLVIGAWFAWNNAFTQDDAYISYNYAKWFSRGYGLVWYPGSSEFGYTSFLYTLMIGVGMLFRLPPEVTSGLINGASFISCLVVAYAMAVRVLGNRWLGVLPVLLLATHHTFTSYATGGLETMWTTLLILIFYWHILTRRERGYDDQYLRLGAIAAVVLLTRLDTALLLAPGYLFTLLAGMQRMDVPAARVQLLRMQDAILIPTVVAVGFLLCCFFAYGYALPTTFYVKMPGNGAMILFGLHYLWLYNTLQLYLPFFLPFFLFYFFYRRGDLRKFGGFTLLLAGVVLLWLAYIAYVGGDFMEFRFLVPVLPFYYMLMFRLVPVLLPKRHTVSTLAMLALFLAANALHPTLFRTKPGALDFNQVPMKFEYAFVESTDSLEEWLTVQRTNWLIIGKNLGRLFHTGSSTDVKIALGNVGVISYYSELPVFDVLGLNSRIVGSAYNRSQLSTDNYDIINVNRPGHNVVASDTLLRDEKIVLNFAFPHAVCKHGTRFVFSQNDATMFPFTRHQTVFIPLENDCFVVADYITPHPKVEELLNKKVMLRYRDVARDTDCPDWLCLR